MTWTLLLIGFTGLLFFGCSWLTALTSWKMRGPLAVCFGLAAGGFALLGASRAVSFFLVKAASRQLDAMPQLPLHVQSILSMAGCLALYFALRKAVSAMRRAEDRNPFQVEDLRAKLDEAFRDWGEQ